MGKRGRVRDRRIGFGGRTFSEDRSSNLQQPGGGGAQSGLTPFIWNSIWFKLGFFGLFLCLGMMTAVSRASQIISLGYPRGHNGYFYLFELTYRLETGSGYYTKRSFFFPLITNISRLLNLSPLEALHWTSWASLTLFALGIALIACTRRSWFLAPGLFYLAVKSDGLFYLHYGIIRQGVADSVLSLGLACLAARPPPRARKWLHRAALALFLVSGLLHILVAVLGVLFLIADAVSEARQSRRASAALQFGTALFLIVGASLFLYYNPRNVLAQLEWSDWFPWRGVGGYSPREIAQHELCFWSACVFVIYGVFARSFSLSCWLSWPIYFFMLAPIWTRGDALWIRFVMCSSALFMIGAALMSRAGPSRLPWMPSASTLLIPLLAGIFLVNVRLPDQPRYIGPPEYELIIAHQKELAAWIPENSFIKAPRGIQYCLTYFLRRAAAMRWPERRGAFSHYYETLGDAANIECRDIAGFREGIPRGTACVRLAHNFMIRQVQPP